MPPDVIGRPAGRRACGAARSDANRRHAALGHVAGAGQGVDLLAERRGAQSDRLLDEGELDPAGSRKRRADPEPVGGVDEGVELGLRLVLGAPNHDGFRRYSHPPISISTAAATAAATTVRASPVAPNQTREPTITTRMRNTAVTKPRL